MPFDDTGFLVENTIADAPQKQTDSVLQLLERGLARVTAGWCKKEYYREVPGAIRYQEYPSIVSLISGVEAEVNFYTLRPTTQPQYCALGGIIGNRNPRAALSLDESLAITYLTMELPHYGKVDTYNDDPTTTQDDIIALYERAIANRKRLLMVR